MLCQCPQRGQCQCQGCCQGPRGAAGSVVVAGFVAGAGAGFGGGHGKRVVAPGGAADAPLAWVEVEGVTVGLSVREA